MSENQSYQQNPGEFTPAPQQAPAYNMQNNNPGYQPTPSSALAIASLILGVVGLLSGWLVFGGVLGLVGVILGIVALVKVKKGTASGKGMAIGGIVTGVLGMIVAAVVLILSMIGIGMLSECAQNAVQDSNGNYVCTIHGQTMTISPNDYEAVRR